MCTYYYYHFQPLSVRDMFAKQLLQLSGLSTDKAEAIVKQYPTPSLLFEAYRLAGPSGSSQLLSKLECGQKGRTIGPVLSATLAKLFTQHSFDN